MVKLIPISGRKLCKIVERLGFEILKQIKLSREEYDNMRRKV